MKTKKCEHEETITVSVKTNLKNIGCIIVCACTECYDLVGADDLGLSDEVLGSIRYFVESVLDQKKTNPYKFKEAVEIPF